MDAGKQIAALREKLRYHNEKYYDQDAPEISDYEYDMLQRELRALEAAHRNMWTRIPRPSGSAARPPAGSPR